MREMGELVDVFETQAEWLEARAERLGLDPDEVTDVVLWMLTVDEIGRLIAAHIDSPDPVLRLLAEQWRETQDAYTETIKS